jgi:dihydroorotase
MPEQIEIIKPDDWHIHLRDSDYLTTTVMHCAQRFARAIIMPNLSQPICTVAQALAYRQRILAAVPTHLNFQPLMTLYLTEQTQVDEIKKAHACPHVYAAKLYPAGATTGAQFGVTDIKRLYPVMEVMDELGMPLLIHGEDIDPQTDVFDRERVFIDKHLHLLCEQFKKLKIVLEHISSKEAVQFIENAPDNIAATITAHHLLINRNAMFQDGLRPHYYCLPVAKREIHRQALLAAATSGNAKFFLGTDSAPHSQAKKESACGCAGIYTAHAALELYAEIFAAQNAMDKLEAFSSIHGPRFYGLPVNKEKIKLLKNPWQVPNSVVMGNDLVIPFMQNQFIAWRLASDAEYQH